MFAHELGVKLLNCRHAAYQKVIHSDLEQFNQQFNKERE
jgi:hypothetical protein